MTIEMDDDDLEMLGYGGVLDRNDQSLHYFDAFRVGPDHKIRRPPRLAIKMKCIVCGGETIAMRPHRKKYCSGKCSQEYLRLRRRDLGLTSRGRQRQPRRPGRTQAEREAMVRERYRTDPDFRARRIAASIKWNRNQKVAK